MTAYGCTQERLDGSAKESVRNYAALEAALFLASPRASFVSGAVLVADGGQNLVGSGYSFATVTNGTEPR